MQNGAFTEQRAWNPHGVSNAWKPHGFRMSLLEGSSVGVAIVSMSFRGGAAARGARASQRQRRADRQAQVPPRGALPVGLSSLACRSLLPRLPVSPLPAGPNRWTKLPVDSKEFRARIVSAFLGTTIVAACLEEGRCHSVFEGRISADVLERAMFQHVFDR